VIDAFRKGAVGALVAEGPDIKGFNGSCEDSRIIVQVSDTTAAFQAIASMHRARFSIPLIAVTGSNGKTTVKDMISAVLSDRYNVLKNEGTCNNHIGVPQTLIGLKPEHDICVLEIGTNHPGEIRTLARIARPQAVVITNIGPSHLENFRDLKGVFRAKMEILETLEKKGLVILNGDDEYLASVKDPRFRICRFGMKGASDFSGEIISTGKANTSFKVNGRSGFEIGLLGGHNVYNALAAISASYCFGAGYRSAMKGLAGFAPVSMRLDRTVVRGIEVINDTYNSNPLSMRCALDTIKAYPAKSKWVVSGDMLELGAQAVRLHREMGGYIASSGIAGLVTFGSLSRYTLEEARRGGMNKKRLWHCSSHSEIARIILNMARKGDAVLLKGSRAMRLEKVLDNLEGQG
jgi:UDP-N-acetylmuramoyl-tripeptide--D-alanyl-D-alanine ligase